MDTDERKWFQAYISELRQEKKQLQKEIAQLTAPPLKKPGRSKILRFIKGTKAEKDA